MIESLCLGESLELLIDNRGKNPPYVLEGVPAVSALSVRSGSIDFYSTRAVTLDTWRDWMKEPTRKGDVLLTTEAPLGRVALVPSDGPILPTQRVVCMRGKSGVLDSRFLFYSFQSSAMQTELAGRATGTTVVGIKQSELRRVTVRAPSFAEQRAIAEVLGALDDKIAANRVTARTCADLAEAIFHQASRGAERQAVSELLEPVLGGTPERSREEFWGPNIPWASAGDITSAQNNVVFETSESISELAAMRTRVRPVPRGSVVITARGTVGVVARLGISAAFNQSCYAFIPGALPPAVLFWSIRHVAAEALSSAHGSVFSTITTRTFDHLKPLSVN